MKKFLLLLLSVSPLLIAALPLQITRNGKTDYVIIYTQLEKQAAEELKLHLEKISSAKFQMIPEAKAQNNRKPAFYVGKTAFAQKQIDFSKFSDQESLVKVSGKDIIVTGGRTRGTLYAVYDLLSISAFDPFFSFGIAKVRRFFKLPNFLGKNFKFSSKICFFAPFCGSESLFRYLYPVDFHPSAVIL